MLGARLACVKPAASVRSEPGSNSQVMILNYHDALTFVVRKNLHDGVDRASTHGGSEHDQFHVCILLEERERSDSSIRLLDRKSTRLNSSHRSLSRMPSSA